MHTPGDAAADDRCVHLHVVAQSRVRRPARGVDPVRLGGPRQCHLTSPSRLMPRILSGEPARDSPKPFDLGLFVGDGDAVAVGELAAEPTGDPEKRDGHHPTESGARCRRACSRPRRRAKSTTKSANTEQIDAHVGQGRLERRGTAGDGEQVQQPRDLGQQRPDDAHTDQPVGAFGEHRGVVTDREAMSNTRLFRRGVGFRRGRRVSAYRGSCRRRRRPGVPRPQRPNHGNRCPLRVDQAFTDARRSARPGGCLP